MSMTESLSASEPTPRLIIVMGVCGCGKSTIAEQLADVLNAVYLDADDYHPQESIDKMSRAEALTDKDRWPWLKNFSRAMAQQPGQVVGACSALTRAYRTCLTEAAEEPVLFIYLDGSKTLIRQRMSARENHFMPDSLLDSQFKTLEIPTIDEMALSIDINAQSEQIVTDILSKIGKL